MKEVKIFEDLFKFNSAAENFPITFNQYLLLGEKPLLLHTGSHGVAVELVPRLKSILRNTELSYIFISHFESDECGGLNHLLGHFPDAKPVCSPITANQLKGFGFTGEIIVMKPGESLETKDYNLKFIAYPSEMHLWEGLLAFEEKRDMFISADLCMHWDKMYSDEEVTSWSKEIASITEQQIPYAKALEEIKNYLMKLEVKCIATGHGPFLRVH